MSTTSLDELNAADERGFVSALSNIYEHAPWVAESAARKRPFPTLAALAHAMQQAIKQASGLWRSFMAKKGIKIPSYLADDTYALRAAIEESQIEAQAQRQSDDALGSGARDNLQHRRCYTRFAHELVIRG